MVKIVIPFLFDVIRAVSTCVKSTLLFVAPHFFDGELDPLHRKML